MLAFGGIHGYIRRLGPAWVLIPVSLALLVTGARPAHAQQGLQVTGQGDGPGTCDAQGRCTTLRAAVTSANADRSGDTIAVPAGTYSLGATLELTGSMTVTGVGAGSTFVDGGHAVRVLSVGPQATVTIAGLTVQNGKVGTDEFGAGIRNRGTLTLNDVVVTGNDATVFAGGPGTGGFGGGIASAGNLTVNRGSVSNNNAVTGGGILTFPAAEARPGAATVNGTRIQGNGATLGGGIADFSPLHLNGATVAGQNTAGLGGGLFMDALVVVDNPPLAGAQAFEGIADAAGSTIDSNNAAFNGAGIFVGDGAVLRLSSSTVSNNVAGRFGDGGDGGGIYNNLATLELVNDTISANDAHQGPRPPGVGRGGGIAQFTINGDVGPPIIERPSIKTIVARMGHAAGMDQNGTFVFGNAHSATAVLDFTTIAGNTASEGSGGGGIFGSGTNSAMTLHDTIVARNTGPNCVVQPAVTSSGYNLDDGVSCGLAQTGDQSNADPLLSALADDGGPTATMALSRGSPAVDAADPACGVATDQRGTKRPQGPRCDIGAFELQAATPAPVTPPAPPVTGLAAASDRGRWLPVVLMVLGVVGLGVVVRHGRGA